MAEDDLTVRARIDDELSRPLEDIREAVHDVGDEAERSGRRARSSSRGWDVFGRATERAGRMARTAGRYAKGALLGITAGVTAAAYAAGRLAMSSIRQASDLNESLNAVNVTYGKQAAAVKKLGREAAKSLGLSNVDYNSMAVQFAAFAEAVGGKGPGSVKVLDKLTTRAADFASVMNLEVAEAAELFQSGLAGESEPLRKYGINLSAAAVESYALAEGIIKGKEELTDAQKVQATYGLLMEKTSKTQGDFSNTSDQLANQQRILGARFDNAQAKLGRALLPTMQTGVKWLNREGIPAFKRFSDWFNDEGLPAIGRFVDKARTFYDTHGPQIKSTLADVRDVAEQGADAAKELVDAFLGMPSWARKLLVGGLAGGVVAKKTGLLSLVKGLGKGSGGLLSLASKAKPLPVFVVNNGVPGPDVDIDGRKPKRPPSTVPKVPPLWGGPLFAITSGLATQASNENLSRQAGADNAVAFASAMSQGGGGGMSVPREKGGWFDFSDEPVKKTAAEIEAAAKVLDLARANAAGFGTELDLVGSRKVNPTVKSEQIDRANDALYKFIGYQIDAGRPVAPYISTTSIERAIEAARTLTAEIHAIPTAGLDAGVNYVSGGQPPPRSPRKRGGGGGDRDALPNASPRRSPTATLEPRRTAGGGGGGGSTVNIAPGGVVVNNPTSDVDVKRAIADYVREREERS